MPTDSPLTHEAALALTADVASGRFDDPASGLDAIIRAAQQITGFQTVLVSEIDTVRSDLRVHAVQNTDPGLTVPAGLEIPLTASPCHHVADSAHPFTSGNMHEDAELAELPAAKDMGASAYVGVPVTLSDGSYFGNLVGLDLETHEDSPEAIRWMQVLAPLAATQIERQRAAATS